MKTEKKDDEMEVVEKHTPEDDDSDLTDVEDYYDPRKPTGCMPGCPGHVAAGS